VQIIETPVYEAVDCSQCMDMRDVITTDDVSVKMSRSGTLAVTHRSLTRAWTGVPFRPALTSRDIGI
jgi:hypothetical protein